MFWKTEAFIKKINAHRRTFDSIVAHNLVNWNIRSTDFYIRIKRPPLLPSSSSSTKEKQRHLLFIFFLHKAILNRAIYRRDWVWNRKMHCRITRFLFLLIFFFAFAALRCISLQRIKMNGSLKKGKRISGISNSFHSPYRRGTSKIFREIKPVESKDYLDGRSLTQDWMGTHQENWKCIPQHYNKLGKIIIWRNFVVFRIFCRLLWLV